MMFTDNYLPQSFALQCCPGQSRAKTGEDGHWWVTGLTDISTQYYVKVLRGNVVKELSFTGSKTFLW